MDEHSLVIAARNGSLEAFDQIMIQFQSRVFSVAYGVLREREAALDLVQDVFLKIFHKLNELDDVSKFKSWLLQTAYHEALNRLRTVKPFENVEDQELVHNDAGPEAKLLQGERAGKLHDLLDLLNPKHRTAVVLKYFHGLAVRDIATTLDCSEEVVRNMLYRGIKRMAKGR